ncbi:MAG: TolC family protein [Phenylobacterium sp.]|uniref:efflux transporter outer membrane subunit n=1 Tax=Phenylobacterium sp. TaxID=1871053 RepID=UPI00273298B3|nr:TolC family protein [Phenylobacterium sp.]MDP3173426.1 TolC family protein [Phenylobacterium sp.]
MFYRIAAAETAQTRRGRDRRTGPDQERFPLMRLALPAASAAGLAILTLAGCASVREPTTTLPQTYEAPAGAATPAAGLDTWWTAFGDAQLDGLIDQALRASPDALSAAARLAEARAVAQTALAALLPNGSLQGQGRKTHTEQLSGTVINIPGFSTNGDSESYSANFDVSWEIDLFGRLRSGRRAARGDVAAARFNYEGARASLAANVADTYFQARGLAIQFDEARETVRIQQALQNVADRRAQRGLGAISDADRVAGDLAQAQARAAGLEAELQAARRTLLVLVGRGAEPTANLPVIADLGAVPAVPATLPSELLARRPDVREAQARIASAAGRLDVAERAFFPTFTLTPGLGWSRSLQPEFSSTTRNWSIGGAVSQPILDIPQLLIDLKAQSARTEQAVIDYEKVVQTAFAEAENSLVQLDADRRGVVLLQGGERRAARAYEAARIRYVAGIDDLQQALAAEQAWRATRTQLTTAQVQALRRAVQAYKALGGGWPAESLPMNARAR